MRLRNLTIALLGGLIPTGVCIADLPGKLIVDAGKFDRRNTIVPFTVPQGTAASFNLIADDGSAVAVQVRGTRAWFILDLTTTQSVVDSPLTLVKYHYGGLGFRGRREWKGKDGITFLTSEGNDRKTGNETRGRWCWCGAPVDGQTIGITIMDHPGNFRAPQPMRLNPDEPFFCYCPSQLDDWTIEKGKPYVARYRFVTADSAADVEEINRLWNDYAEPPKVTLE